MNRSVRLLSLLAALPAGILIGILLVAAGGIAYADFVTDQRLSLYLLFAPLVAVAAWRFGAATGVGSSLAAALVTLLRDFASATAPSAADYAAGLVRFAVFASVAYVLVQLKRSLSEQRRLAGHDPLTGLANRQRLFLRGERELSNARRDGGSFAALFIDCDQFKAVNDRWGHATGDELLCELAESIRAVFGDAYLAARLGGDEFVIVSGSTDNASLRPSAERLQAQFAARMAGRGHALTVSIGGVLFHQPPPTLDEVIAAADEMMYAVKRRGGNGIELRDVRLDYRPQAAV